MIGQFGFFGLPPSDAKGKLAIENECKNISTRYNFFEFWAKSHNFHIVIIRLLCFESERKSENCIFVAEKLGFEYLLYR